MDHETLIRHLPPRLAEIKEIADIQYALDPEVEDILSTLIKMLKNRFPDLADLSGITDWEEFLDITPDSSLSLQERRENVIIKINSRIPYTKVQLHRALASAVGWGNYDFTIENFELLIDIAFDCYDKIPAVKTVLDRMLPAHILHEVKMYIEADLGVAHGCAYQIGKELDIYPYNDPTPIEASLGIVAAGAMEIYRVINIG